MALTIPAEEYDLCMKLARPGYVALALTNDLYSWKKERMAAEAAGRGGDSCIFNGIWVIMNSGGLSELEDVAAREAKAIEICREEIRKYVAQYRSIVDDAKSKPDLYSPDLRAYLEAILYTISGNLVWSITCPRYNTDGC